MTARRVLLVDDNFDAVNMMALMVSHMGHQAAFVTDPTEALRTAMQIRPEIVFVDIGMPSLDGWELTRRLKQEPTLAGVRVFALTAYNSESDRQESKAAGCDDHLVKPVDPRFIESLLRIEARAAMPRSPVP